MGVERIIFDVVTNLQGLYENIQKNTEAKAALISKFKYAAGVIFAVSGVYSILRRIVLNVVGVFRALTRAIEEQIQAFAKISIPLAELQGITRATTTEIRELHKIIIETSEYFGQSQESILQAGKSLATLGITSARAMQMILPQAVKFSMIMDRNVKEAAELLLKTMRLFNYELSQSEEVIRLLGNSYIKSAANADYLAISLQLSLIHI